MSIRVRRILSFAISLLLIFEQSGFAQIAGEIRVSSHLSLLRTSIAPDAFRLAHLRSVGFDPEKNSFSIIVDKGSVPRSTGAGEESRALLTMFLVGVSLPMDRFWVNLRPDAPDDVLDPQVAKTDIGRIFLEADVQLKKDTARLMSPQTASGREYWDRMYKKAQEIFGAGQVTIPTTVRPWIVPDEIIIRESPDHAYVYKATLKVLLEEDYLKGEAAVSSSDPKHQAINAYSAQLLRELIVPLVTREVNASKQYAALRQAYYSLILAQWFKEQFKGRPGTYAALIDSANIEGLTSTQPWTVTPFFERYRDSFAKGEYHLKEAVATPAGRTIRTYTSGGLHFGEGAYSIPAVKAAGAIALPAGRKPVASPNNTQMTFAGASAPGKEVLTGVAEAPAASAGTSASAAAEVPAVAAVPAASAAERAVAVRPGAWRRMQESVSQWSRRLRWALGLKFQRLREYGLVDSNLRTMEVRVQGSPATGFELTALYTKDYAPEKVPGSVVAAVKVTQRSWADPGHLLVRRQRVGGDEGASTARNLLVDAAQSLKEGMRVSFDPAEFIPVSEPGADFSDAPAFWRTSLGDLLRGRSLIVEGYDRSRKLLTLRMGSNQEVLRHELEVEGSDPGLAEGIESYDYVTVTLANGRKYTGSYIFASKGGLLIDRPDGSRSVPLKAVVAIDKVPKEVLNQRPFLSTDLLVGHGTNAYVLLLAMTRTNGQLRPSGELPYAPPTGESGGATELNTNYVSTVPLFNENNRTFQLWEYAAMNASTGTGTVITLENVDKELAAARSRLRSNPAHNRRRIAQLTALKAFLQDLASRGLYEEYLQLSSLPVVLIGDGVARGTVVNSRVSNEQVYRRVNIRAVAVEGAQAVARVNALLASLGINDIAVFEKDEFEPLFEEYHDSARRRDASRGAPGLLMRILRAADAQADAESLESIAARIAGVRDGEDLINVAAEIDNFLTRGVAIPAYAQELLGKRRFSNNQLAALRAMLLHAQGERARALDTELDAVREAQKAAAASAADEEETSFFARAPASVSVGEGRLMEGSDTIREHALFDSAGKRIGSVLLQREMRELVVRTVTFADGAEQDLQRAAYQALLREAKGQKLALRITGIADAVQLQRIRGTFAGEELTELGTLGREFSVRIGALAAPALRTPDALSTRLRELIRRIEGSIVINGERFTVLSAPAPGHQARFTVFGEKTGLAGWFELDENADILTGRVIVSENRVPGFASLMLRNLMEKSGGTFVLDRIENPGIALMIERIARSSRGAPLRVRFRVASSDAPGRELALSDITEYYLTRRTDESQDEPVGTFGIRGGAAVPSGERPLPADLLAQIQVTDGRPRMRARDRAQAGYEIRYGPQYTVSAEVSPAQQPYDGETQMIIRENAGIGRPEPVSPEHLAVLQDPAMGPDFRVPEVRLVSPQEMERVCGDPEVRVFRQGNTVYALESYWSAQSPEQRLDILMHEAMADWAQRKGVDAGDVAIDIEGLRVDEAARRARHTAAVDRFMEGEEEETVVPPQEQEEPAPVAEDHVAKEATLSRVQREEGVAAKEAVEKMAARLETGSRNKFFSVLVRIGEALSLGALRKLMTLAAHKVLTPVFELVAHFADRKGIAGVLEHLTLSNVRRHAVNFIAHVRELFHAYQLEQQGFRVVEFGFKEEGREHDLVLRDQEGRIVVAEVQGGQENDNPNKLKVWMNSQIEEHLLKHLNVAGTLDMPQHGRPWGFVFTCTLPDAWNTPKIRQEVALAVEQFVASQSDRAKIPEVKVEFFADREERLIVDRAKLDANAQAIEGWASDWDREEKEAKARQDALQRKLMPLLMPQLGARGPPGAGVPAPLVKELIARVGADPAAEARVMDILRPQDPARRDNADRIVQELAAAINPPNVVQPAKKEASVADAVSRLLANEIVREEKPAPADTKSMRTSDAFFAAVSEAMQAPSEGVSRTRHIEALLDLAERLAPGRWERIVLWWFKARGDVRGMAEYLLGMTNRSRDRFSEESWKELRAILALLAVDNVSLGGQIGKGFTRERIEAVLATAVVVQDERGIKAMALAELVTRLVSDATQRVRVRQLQQAEDISGLVEMALEAVSSGGFDAQTAGMLQRAIRFLAGAQLRQFSQRADAPAVVDYEQFFLGEGDAGRNTISLIDALFLRDGSGVVAPGLQPLLAEALLHEAMEAVTREGNHAELYRGVQRTIFGQANPLGKQLRQFIDAQVAAAQQAQGYIPVRPESSAPRVKFLASANIGGEKHKEFWVASDGSLWIFKENPYSAEPYRGLGVEIYYTFVLRFFGMDQEAYACSLPDPTGKMRSGALEKVLLTEAGKGVDWRQVQAADVHAAFERSVPVNFKRLVQEGKISPKDLNAVQISQVLREMVLGWLFSNHDMHQANYVVDDSGNVIGIDKEQVFKYFPGDRLDLTYMPNGFGFTPLHYQVLAFLAVTGKLDLALIESTLARIDSIPDEEYRAMLEPFAEQFAQVHGASRFPGKDAKEEFLRLAIARKHSLRADFAAFFKSLQDAFSPKPVSETSVYALPAAKQELGALMKGADIFKNMIVDAKAKDLVGIWEKKIFLPIKDPGAPATEPSGPKVEPSATEPVFNAQPQMHRQMAELYGVDAQFLRKVQEAGGDPEKLIAVLQERFDAMMESERLTPEQREKMRARHQELIEKIRAPPAKLKVLQSLFRLLTSWIAALRQEKSQYHRVYLARDGGFFYMIDKALELAQGKASEYDAGASVYLHSRARMGGESTWRIYYRMKDIIDEARALSNGDKAAFHRELRRLFREQYDADRQWREMVDATRKELEALGYDKMEKIVFVDTGFKGTNPFFLKCVLEQFRPEEALVDEAGEQNVQVACVQPSDIHEFAQMLFGFDLALFSPEERSIIEGLAKKFSQGKSVGSHLEDIEVHPVEFNERTYSIELTSPEDRLEVAFEQMFAAQAVAQFLARLAEVPGEVRNNPMLRGKLMTLILKDGFSDYLTTKYDIKELVSTTPEIAKILFKGGPVNLAVGLPAYFAPTDLKKQGTAAMAAALSKEPLVVNDFASFLANSVNADILQKNNAIKEGVQVKSLSQKMAQEFSVRQLKLPWRLRIFLFLSNILTWIVQMMGIQADAVTLLANMLLPAPVRDAAVGLFHAERQAQGPLPDEALAIFDFGKKGAFVSGEGFSPADPGLGGLVSLAAQGRVRIMVADSDSRQLFTDGTQRAPFFCRVNPDGTLTVYVGRGLFTQLTGDQHGRAVFAATLDYLVKFARTGDRGIAQDVFNSRCATLGLLRDEASAFLREKMGAWERAEKWQVAPQGPGVLSSRRFAYFPSIMLAFISLASSALAAGPQEAITAGSTFAAGAVWAVPIVVSLVWQGMKRIGKVLVNRAPQQSEKVLQEAVSQLNRAAYLRNPYELTGITLAGRMRAVELVSSMGNNTWVYAVEGFPHLVFKVFIQKGVAFWNRPDDPALREEYRGQLRRKFEQEVRRMAEVSALLREGQSETVVDGVRLVALPRVAPFAYLESGPDEAGVLVQLRSSGDPAFAYQVRGLKETLAGSGVDLEDDKTANAQKFSDGRILVTDLGALRAARSFAAVEDLEAVIAREFREALRDRRPVADIFALVIPQLPEESALRQAAEELRRTVSARAEFEVDLNALAAKYGLTEPEVRLLALMAQPGQGAGPSGESAHTMDAYYRNMARTLRVRDLESIREKLRDPVFLAMAKERLVTRVRAERGAPSPHSIFFALRDQLRDLGFDPETLSEMYFGGVQLGIQYPYTSISILGVQVGYSRVRQGSAFLPNGVALAVDTVANLDDRTVDEVYAALIRVVELMEEGSVVSAGAPAAEDLTVAEMEAVQRAVSAAKGKSWEEMALAAQQALPAGKPLRALRTVLEGIVSRTSALPGMSFDDASAYINRELSGLQSRIAFSILNTVSARRSVPSVDVPAIRQAVIGARVEEWDAAARVILRHLPSDATVDVLRRHLQEIAEGKSLLAGRVEEESAVYERILRETGLPEDQAQVLGLALGVGWNQDRGAAGENAPIPSGYGTFGGSALTRDLQATLQTLTGMPYVLQSQLVYPLPRREDVNQTITFARWMGTQFFERLQEIKREPPRRVRILVIGTGAGVDLLTLWHQAVRAGVPVDIDAIDVKKEAVANTWVNVGRAPRAWQTRGDTVSVKLVEPGKEFDHLAGRTYDFIAFNAPDAVSAATIPEQVSDRSAKIEQEVLQSLMRRVRGLFRRDTVMLLEHSENFSPFLKAVFRKKPIKFLPEDDDHRERLYAEGKTTRTISELTLPTQTGVPAAGAARTMDYRVAHWSATSRSPDGRLTGIQLVRVNKRNNLPQVMEFDVEYFDNFPDRRQGIRLYRKSRSRDVNSVPDLMVYALPTAHDPQMLAIRGCFISDIVFERGVSREGLRNEGLLEPLLGLFFKEFPQAMYVHPNVSVLGLLAALQNFGFAPESGRAPNARYQRITNGENQTRTATGRHRFEGRVAFTDPAAKVRFLQGSQVIAEYEIVDSLTGESVPLYVGEQLELKDLEKFEEAMRPFRFYGYASVPVFDETVERTEVAIRSVVHGILRDILPASRQFEGTMMSLASVPAVKKAMKDSGFAPAHASKALELVRRLLDEAFRAADRGKLNRYLAVKYIDALARSISSLKMLRISLEKSRQQVYSEAAGGDDLQLTLMLKEMEDLSDDLQYLIDLLVSRVEFIRGSGDEQLTDVETVLRSVLGRFSLPVSLSVPAERVIIKANSLTLESALNNLVANAVSFAQMQGLREGTTPQVGVRVTVDQDNTVRIEISDNGTGVPAEFLETDPTTGRLKVFNLDASGKDLKVGLGTTEAWYAFKDMGGTVEVSSVQGATVFTVRGLPRVGPSSSAEGEGPDASGPLPGPADQAPAAPEGKTGGIDLRMLPLVRQPAPPGAAPVSSARPGYGIKEAGREFDAEIVQMQVMVRAGVVPSSQRIKEYLLSVSLSSRREAGLEQALSCVAEILRLEESRAERTEESLRRMLRLVETDAASRELHAALSKVVVEEQEPQKIE